MMTNYDVNSPRSRRRLDSAGVDFPYIGQNLIQRAFFFPTAFRQLDFAFVVLFRSFSIFTSTVETHLNYFFPPKLKVEDLVN